MKKHHQQKVFIKQEKQEAAPSTPGLGLLNILGGFMKGIEDIGDQPKPSEAAAKKPVDTELTGRFLQSWAHLKNLKMLSLEHAVKLTDVELKALNELSSLERLNLSNTKVTGECFKNGKVLLHLKELILKDCRYLTDKGLRHIGTLTGLERLYISHCDIDGSCLKEWKGLVNLKELYIRACPKLLDRNLKYLDELPSLEIIDLSAC